MVGAGLNDHIWPTEGPQPCLHRAWFPKEVADPVPLFPTKTELQEEAIGRKA